jgi:hypothetical protein
MDPAAGAANFAASVLSVAQHGRDVPAWWWSKMKKLVLVGPLALVAHLTPGHTPRDELDMALV